MRRCFPTRILHSSSVLLLIFFGPSFLRQETRLLLVQLLFIQLLRSVSQLRSTQSVLFSSTGQLLSTEILGTKQLFLIQLLFGQLLHCCPELRRTKPILLSSTGQLLSTEILGTK
jgi:hypothetical protein